MPRGIPNQKLDNSLSTVEEQKAGGSPLVMLSHDGQDGWRLQAWDVEGETLVEALRLALVDQVARGEGHAPIDVRFSGSTRLVRTAPASATPSSNGRKPAPAEKRTKRLPVESRMPNEIREPS